MINIIKKELLLEESIKKKIINLNKDKNDISDEIDKKKYSIIKLLLSPKNQLWEDNKKRLSLFNIIEIERTTKHLNNETDESSKYFYKTKKKTMDYNYKSINIFL